MKRSSVPGLLAVSLWAFGCGSNADNGGGGDDTSAGGAGGAGGTTATGGASTDGGTGGKAQGTGGKTGAGGGSATGGSTGAGGGTSTMPVVKSDGCGKDMPYDTTKAFKPDWLFWGAGTPQGDTSLPITVGSSTRHFGLYIPNAYDSNTPMPLVMGIHGCSGNDNVDQSGVQGASGDAAIFVYPKGDLHPCGGSGGWDWSPGSDDFTYIDALLVEVESTLCIDKNEVLAYGFSMGGYMSNALGCYRGDVFRAVSPEEGGQPQWTGCKGPVAAMVIHGDADGAVSISEGRAARDHWLAADSCGTTTKPFDPSPCVSYDGCAAGKPVVYCEIPGLGHVVWGADQTPVTEGVATWNFFSQFVQ